VRASQAADLVIPVTGRTGPVTLRWNTVPSVRAFHCIAVTLTVARRIADQMSVDLTRLAVSLLWAAAGPTCAVARLTFPGMWGAVEPRGANTGRWRD
jgi:hypothetical protein